MLRFIIDYIISWIALIAIIFVVMMALYKLFKLKPFGIVFGRLFFVVLTLWLGLLIYSGEYRLDSLMLYIFVGSIAIFLRLIGYAIHNKQIKSYLKTLTWIIGTPIVIVIVYVAIAILTHDPVVPRPLTVHQLLTGYNIVYTHDGKLYQNDEFVMDMEVFSGEDNIAGNQNGDCDTCIHGRLDVYGSLYLGINENSGGFKYEIDMSNGNKEVKKIQKTPFFLGYKTKPYYRDGLHPTRDGGSILSNNLGYLIKSPLPKEEKHREEYVSNRHNRPTQYEYIRQMVDEDGNIIDTINIAEEKLKSIILEMHLTGFENNRLTELNIIGIANQKPVIEIIQGQARYLLQGIDILLQNHHSIKIHNNSIYSLGDLSHIDDYGRHMKKVYKNGEEYGSSPVSWHFVRENKMIQDGFCPIISYYGYIGSLFCNIDEKLRDTPVLDLLIMQLNIPVGMRSLLQYGGSPNLFNGAVTQEGFISTIPSRINLQENKNKLFRYHNVISNIIGYLYHIRGSFNSFKEILSSKNLYRTLSDHYFSTDTILLRPFHNSGREYSEAIPLISGIDNFFGVYPTTPPKNNDPNADINVGQLIMDTYKLDNPKQNDCLTFDYRELTITNYPISFIGDLGEICAAALSNGTAGTIALYKDDMRISHVLWSHPQSGILMGEYTGEYPIKLTGTIRGLLYNYTGSVDLVISLINHCPNGGECELVNNEIRIPVQIEGIKRHHMDTIYKRILSDNKIDFLYSKTLDLLPLYGLNDQGEFSFNYSIGLGTKNIIIDDYETCLYLIDAIGDDYGDKDRDCLHPTIMLEFGFVNSGEILLKIILLSNDNLTLEKTYPLSRFTF